MPAIRSTDDPIETLELVEEAHEAVLRIAPARGGMVTRFSVRGAQMLYLDVSTLRDPGQSVRGGIPILFPISGKLPDGHYEFGGVRRAMKQHGFARNLSWRVVAEHPNVPSVTLGLEASELTRAQYPFEFSLRFTYALREGSLVLEQVFQNRGTTPMPIQPGLHPYFFVPDAMKARAHLDTDATRAFDNTASKEVQLTGPISFAGREVDLHLLDHGPRTTSLHRPGLPTVRLSFGEDQRVLVVWTLPGRDFICVEPWSEKFGALAEGGARWVPPGEQVSTTLTLSLVAP